VPSAVDSRAACVGPGRDTVRLHIENSRRRPAIYHVTPERWQAACARHPDLARQLEVSIGWDGDILDDALKTAAIVIGVPEHRDRLYLRAPALRWLHATSAGVEDLFPLDWLPRGVRLTNNRGAHGAKAEQFMRMAYAMLHARMPEIITNQREHRWQQVFSPGMVGATALVIGLGDLGMAAARAARQLGMQVIGVRRTGRKCRYADTVYSESRLDEVLPQADFVVLATPLTPRTRNLLNGDRLRALKPTAGVINIARAAVADYDVLAEQLGAGRLAGAILDVVDPEPLPADSPLWEVKNLLITPHISCDDADHYVAISLDLWFRDFARFLRGKRLSRRVDPRRGY
jgi:phosphoglycerate dehydrogenase-like enzyme